VLLLVTWSFRSSPGNHSPMTPLRRRQECDEDQVDLGLYGGV